MKPFSIFNADTIADFISRHPWWMLALGLGLTGFLAVGMAQLRLEADYEIFFSPGAEEIQEFRQFQQDFGREDTLFFAMSAPTGESIVREESLKAISEFTQQARAIPHVRRVSSIANYPVVEAQNDTIDIAPAYYIEDGEVVSDRPMAAIESRLLAESTVKHKLLSDDGNTAGILATLVLDEESRSATAGEVWSATQTLLAEMRSNYPGYRFRVTGSTALDAAFAQANEHDLSMLFPAALTVMVLLAAVLFRSLMFYIAMSLVVCSATVSCLGFAGWAGIPLSSVSITSPVIVVILSIAEVMHLFVASRKQEGDTRQSRNRAAVQKVLVPAALTTVTTMAGLLMLNLSATPPFKHLGNIAAVGVFAAFLYTFLLGAPILRFVRPQGDKATPMDGLMSSIARFVTGPKGQVTGGVVAVAMVGLSAGVFLNKIDDNYVEYFDKSFEFRGDSDFIDRKLSGIHRLEYSLEAENSNVFSKDYLNAVNAFADWARQQPGVRSVDTIEESIAQVNQAFNNDDTAFRHAPASNDKIQQYSMLYEMSVPQDFDYRHRVSSGRDTSRVTLYLSNLSISEIDALDEKASGWLSNNAYFGDEPRDAFGATGTSILFSHIGLNNIRDMLWGTGLLFFMASALMWVIFRKPAIAASATVANILPALATLGLWGVLVGRLGMGSDAVVAVTLGIMIDDTIHLGHRYLKGRRQGMDAVDAVSQALMQVGPALVMTTLILVVGFLMISLSAFEINASMGMVVASTVAIALIFDLTVLPAALIRFDTKKQPAIEEIPHAT